MISTPVISSDVALALVRAAAGLIVAAHGAQKAFGVWGGPGFSGWTQAMARMGLRAPTLWAYLSAGAELVGGIAFALGLLVPVAGALLTMQMAVAMQRVHWAKGFWNGKGGIEYSFLVAAVAAVGGIADPSVYSLDRAFGLPMFGAGVYFLVLAAAGIAYLASSRSRAEPRGDRAT